MVSLCPLVIMNQEYAVRRSFRETVNSGPPRFEMSDGAQETSAQSVCFRQFQQPRAVEQADVNRLFIENRKLGVVRRERHVLWWSQNPGL
jgi:hypothetical protein